MPGNSQGNGKIYMVVTETPWQWASYNGWPLLRNLYLLLSRAA